jgi:RimJ/RimL family protein N-acetyltransferase
MNCEPTHTFRTKTGLLVSIRPLRPDDTQNLVDIFEHLSPDSRYLRFHEALNNPTNEFIQEKAEEMATIPEKKGKGWLAFADLPDQPCAPIGGVRLVRLPETTDAAEVALTVRDDLQGQGIGRELLELVIKQAREEDIRRLIAVVQAGNRAVLKLLGDTPYPISRSLKSGEVYVEADISPCPLTKISETPPSTTLQRLR